MILYFLIYPLRKEFSADFLRKRIDIKRFNNESGLYYTIPLDIDKNSDFFLLPKDRVVLYSRDVTEKSFS